MTQNNNLSVLPFYTNIEQQNHRKSYAFGAIYPLFAPANMLLPFQIMRTSRAEAFKGNELFNSDYDSGYLNENGEWKQDQLHAGVGQYDYVVGTIYFENIPKPLGVMAVAYNDDYEVIEIFNPEFDNRFTGTWELPENTYFIRVQTYVNGIGGSIYQAIFRPTTIKQCVMFDKNNNVVADLTNDMLDVGLQVVPFPNLGYDIIVFPARFPMITSMADGMYYLSISDGVQTWYSDIITIVQDVTAYLKIEWWDVENFVFDAGQIVYQNPEFKNRLYLCTELGKPEYKFDEEGETRDGYFFPEKQISEKTYKCTIVAPEYLCDVMRFIRMADYVRITDKYGRKYKVDTFLITPKWQTQGDLASVEIEFETNTVVKKIGKGYTIQGDFNADFNNDFNN